MEYKDVKMGMEVVFNQDYCGLISGTLGTVNSVGDQLVFVQVGRRNIACYPERIDPYEEEHLITMEDQWAFEDDPYTPVRVLCVDRPDPNYPVVIMYGESVYFRNDKGKLVGCRSLVPLKVKKEPRVRWWIEGALLSWTSKEKADSYNKMYYKGKKKIIKLVEELEEDS